MKTVKDYNLPLNSPNQQQHEKISTVQFYHVCADTVKAKQSKAQHSRIWAQAMHFLPIKQVDL